MKSILVAVQILYILYDDFPLTFAATDSHGKQDAITTSNNGAPSGPPSKPYSIYTASEKWFIVALTGFAAMFRYAFTHICPLPFSFIASIITVH